MTAKAPTMHARPGHGAGSADPGEPRREAGMPTALLGMLLFIASEVMFFGGLFATYFNARAQHAGEWHPPPGGHIDPVLAGVLTVILVASSFTMQFGVWAIRRGDQGKLKMWVAITLALGVLFLAGQLYDYSVLGFGISDGIFATTFYTLTGFHGAHVFGGAVGLTIVLARSLQGQFSSDNHVAVEAVSMYWHFVDVVWIALFATIYILG